VALLFGMKSGCYIDSPFHANVGGDKNRSVFLWRALGRSFSIAPVWVAAGDAGAPPDGASGLRLPPERSSFWMPESVHAFSAGALARFEEFLRQHPVDFIFSRFYSHARLLDEARRRQPGLPVVVDVDMLHSRLVAFAWAASPTLRHRWFLIERFRLRQFERRLFQNPWLFLFSNAVERDMIRLRHPRSAGRFEVLPNCMPAGGSDAPPPPDRKVILFFGVLDSAANHDGLKFLVEEILPRLEPVLRKHDTVIQVAGRGAGPALKDLVARAGSDRIVLQGEVASMSQAISDSAFALLPLRVASGTRTRILEAAAMSRTVVTTPLGAEGIEFSEREGCIESTADGLAAAVIRLLEQPSLAREMGLNLRKCCTQLYHPDRVEADLVRWVEESISGKKRECIAL
jgi:glycosyltransferase involved in cell wall biosynthesis